MSEQLKLIQSTVGVSPDGIYGPSTEHAIAVALDCVLEDAPPTPAPPAPVPDIYPPPNEGIVTDLTLYSFCFLASEEGMVKEMYYDSVGVGTWALGVTNSSGHTVDPRYKDNPQHLEKCIEISVWLIRESYLPAVFRAFEGYPLHDNELAAALSFHWNTGAIETTSWVDMVKEGEMDQAREFLENHYLNDGDLQARRNREAALFFDNMWPYPMLMNVYPVNKPSYTPDWGGANQVDILAIVGKLYGLINKIRPSK